MQPTILGDFVDDLSRSREPGGVRGEARRPGLARPRGRAGALARSILRPSAGEPKAGCASRRPPESLRPAPCEPPAPGQNRPAGLPVALARAVAPARHAAAAFLVVFAALLAVSTTAQAQTTGICGRTAAVRTAILGKISGVSNCASVTDAHLTAITGTLNLSNKGITALAAGDFDKLTALTRLYLDSNSLTTLPAGVFDGLTALTELQLYNNSLSTLPAGVFDKLTSLTILDLGANSLTTLPAGVFDELTALEDLRLDRNSLTTLPDGVFDELTALEDLRLGVNDLSTLPAGMFDKLTSLTSLYLFDNQLATLPAGVFDELTSLTSLQLQGNSGAPFSPTAVALPDDGTVLDAGGDVTLDGSGSDGGPWGTNVTYSWAASGATVTFDDAASATPVVTIPALADGTELTFTLTVTGRATDASYGTAPDTDTATVTATNAAPAFTSSATFSAAENQTAAGTVEASDSDTGDSVTGYEIQGGADQSAFSIVETSGVLTFRSAPNFEDATDDDASNTYVVVVRATSGTGARAKTEDQTITVTVTDVDGEAPGVPAAPTVSAASVSSVTAAWAAPANAGPPITDYDYRYQVKSTAPGWTEVTNTTITALSATITGLAEDTEYEVQVRATNDEGTSGWSDPGSASTDANAAPAFTSSATFSAAENQTAAGTVEASDSDTGDSVTGYDDPGRRGPVGVLDRRIDERGADVQVGAELRGRDGRRRQQHVRGGGAGDQRHGRAGEDGGPDDHGDGDGRGRRGAGRPGRADGVGGVGEQRDGGLGRARERRAADHGLRLPVPGEVDGSGMDGGDEHDDHGVERDDHGARGGHGVRGAGAGDQRRGHERLVRPGQRLDGRERGAGVHLVGDVQRGGEPDRGGDGRGVGQRHGRQRDGLCDPGRRGPVGVLDRRDERGADVQVGAELRGRDGRRRQQHVRGGGAGDQRHGRAGIDGGPDDHGDGDGRGRRGAGRPGRADGVGGVGEQPDGGLGRARERRAADHGLRLPVPGEVDGSGMDGGDEHDEHGVERDDHGARGGHGVRGAGAGDQRRGHERLVRPGQRLDGRERGAAVHVAGDVQRGGEPDRGGDGRGVGQRHGRQRDGL